MKELTTVHQHLTGDMLVVHFRPVDDKEHVDKPYEVTMKFDGKFQMVIGDTEQETLGYMVDLVHETLWERCKKLNKKHGKGLILKK